MEEDILCMHSYNHKGKTEAEKKCMQTNTQEFGGAGAEADL